MMEYFEFRAMNSTIVLAAEGRPELVAKGFQAAQEFIEESERRLSRFSAQSELCQLNSTPGRWFPASPALFELVKLARHYYQQTNALFDPSILPELKQAGYDRSMDEIRAQGAVAHETEWQRQKIGFDKLRLAEQSRQIWLPAGMEIDLGGIAKGWIAEQAARILARYAAACAVNAGGDMYLIGTPEDQSAWEIALEDPRDPEQTLASLYVPSGAVATSSIAKRSWRQGGRLRHHLIDPRTGQPADTDWLSVTVAAAQATTAEVYAKVLLIAGSSQAQEIISKNGEIRFVAVNHQGNLWGSPNSRELFDVNPGIHTR
jgi:thiamine biosynthesis lipoprotein